MSHQSSCPHLNQEEKRKEKRRKKKDSKKEQEEKQDDGNEEASCPFSPRSAPILFDVFHPNRDFPPSLLKKWENLLEIIVFGYVSFFSFCHFVNGYISHLFFFCCLLLSSKKI